MDTTAATLPKQEATLPWPPAFALPEALLMQLLPLSQQLAAVLEDLLLD
jgi:hypothetical protein